MSVSWPDSKQEGLNPLDSTLFDFLTFDCFDQLDRVEPTVDAVPDTLALPSEVDFDWSSGIDPSLCQLSNPTDFIIESPIGSDNISGQLSTDERSLTQTILHLGSRMDQLERETKAWLAQMEEHIRGMGQRLMKAEETKEIHDAEYAQLRVYYTLESR
jgi:hypothetical protein